MKIYHADQELEEVLLKGGFIETTRAGLKQYGKKTFSTSLRSQKKIFFNNENIELLYSEVVEDSQTELTEGELRCLLVYFKLISTDIEYLTPRGFKIKAVCKRFEQLRQKLENDHIAGHLERKHIRRLLDLYDTVI